VTAPRPDGSLQSVCRACRDVILGLAQWDEVLARGQASARGESGYPQVRFVTLMALRSHLLAAVRFGPYATSELALARELWEEIPDDSLTILDRAFLAASPLLGLPLLRRILLRK